MKLVRQLFDVTPRHLYAICAGTTGIHTDVVRQPSFSIAYKEEESNKDSSSFVAYCRTVS